MAKQNLYDDDDGRVICNMDVEGMPWHDKRIRREQRAARTAQGIQMTRRESRIFTWYAVLAGLTIVLVFSVVWVLFTLFATQVWFR
jgi:hypothetical protein